MTDPTIPTIESRAVDARVRFYLENRERIETWSALRSDAQQLCLEVATELLPSAEELAVDRGLTLTDTMTGRWRIIAIHPPETPMAKDGTPVASVALSWSDRVILDHPEDCPWVGVRIARREQKGQAVHASVSKVTRPERKRRGANKNSWWPIWEPIRAETSWWDEPQPYLDHVVHMLEEYLDLFAEPVAAALSPSEVETAT